MVLGPNKHMKSTCGSLNGGLLRFSLYILSKFHSSSLQPPEQARENLPIHPHPRHMIHPQTLSCNVGFCNREVLNGALL